MLSLPMVEMVAARGGGDSSEHFLRALRISMGYVNFGKVTFFTNEEIGQQDGIEVRKVNAMDKHGYSRFCIRELPKHVSLPFCLIVQSDGFVCTPDCWTDKFLRYDYIGAPWASEMVSVEDRVGNGGFSLRSRKFLDTCLRFPFELNQNEDHLLCRTYRKWMVEQGVQFAPINVAAKFAREQELAEFNNNLMTCFGFHGWGPGRDSFRFMIYGFDQ